MLRLFLTGQPTSLLRSPFLSHHSLLLNFTFCSSSYTPSYSSIFAIPARIINQRKNSLVSTRFESESCIFFPSSQSLLIQQEEEPKEQRVACGGIGKEGIIDLLMASVFLYHVVGDLTVGKPELSEFPETETVAAAIRAIGDSTEGGIPVWRKRSQKSVIESAETRQQRFVGIINALDIVAFLAREDCLGDQDKAISTPVSEVVVPDNSALKVVDPGTRLIDALEMMKQGVKRLVVPKSSVWRGMSKRFSILYNGKWLKNIDPSGASSTNTLANANRPTSSSTSSIQNRFCCLSREDVLRFLIGCLGALAPLPLSSIASLGAINPNFSCIVSSSPAIEATKKLPHDPCAVAVVEATPDGLHKIIGEISSAKLWKCDYLSAAWGMANLSAGQFVMGVEDNHNVGSKSLPDIAASYRSGEPNLADSGGLNKARTFSSRSIGFLSNGGNLNLGMGRSMYRGRSTPLTCKVTSSLAAVMAQMLSHRASHVWVTEDQNDDLDTLVGVVGYTDIIAAVTRQPAATISETQSS